MRISKIRTMLEVAGYAINYKNIIDCIEDAVTDVNDDGTITVYGWDEIWQEHKCYEFNLADIVHGRLVLNMVGFRTAFQRWLLWSRLERMS